MRTNPSRRSIITCLGTIIFLPFQFLWADSNDIQSLPELEKSSRGRLGVHAVDTASNRVVAYRSEERFPMCSTFKVILAGAMLDESTRSTGILNERLTYREDELIQHSPITEKHVGTGMTVSELCAATIQYSDNTAANVLLKRLGGPEALTRFTKKIGDPSFRLDRWEPALNTAIPDDPRDTTTPAAMTATLQALTLGNALNANCRTMLLTWMDGNTTGDKRIRARVPEGWRVGDKTGSGSYGTTNDVAVIRPPGKAAIVITIFLTGPEKDSPWRDNVIAKATTITLRKLALSSTK